MSFDKNGSFHHPQLLLGDIEAQVCETSPVSKFNCEVEQKYIFRGKDPEQVYAHYEHRVSEFCSGKGIVVVPFDGTDYCFNVMSRGSLYSFRYRTGHPVNHRMGVKVKNGTAAMVRKEIEFHLREGTELSKILEYLKSIASLGQSFLETQIRVRGNIRYLPLDDGTDRKVEIVVFLGTNLVTTKTVTVAEIEAHGFEKISEAKKIIRHYEDLLGWKRFRTAKNMGQLLG